MANNDKGIVHETIDGFGNLVGYATWIIIIGLFYSWLSPYIDMVVQAYNYVWGSTVTPVIEFFSSVVEYVKGWFEK